MKVPVYDHAVKIWIEADNADEAWKELETLLHKLFEEKKIQDYDGPM